ncbi:MAG: site-specific integrase [Planctomycetota bacterium]|nr:site-specific integrase [Planctomycetota bacterium]MDE1889196.1 site-specific integrase [Planctomycetota bacterium]MDE2216705.1 site-specific integrase [Planctomycetota bacterium]
MFKRGGVWWTCIRYEDKKVQKSLETDDRRLAQAIEAKIRAEIAEGKFFDKPVGQSKTFNDMMEKFMREHAPKVSINTQKSYSVSLKHLLLFFGNSRLTGITPKMISDCKVLRYSEGAKPASINRELAMLSKAFNLAVKEWEWIKENPVLKVPKEKENNERDQWLTGDEEKKLLENSPQWLRDLIVFALHTGLRQDELLSLQWSRVDLFRKTIIIQESKSGKPRTIPLNQIALNILIEKAKIRNIKSDLVFLSNAMTKINCQNLIRALNIALKKAGIQNFHWHSLRHTFATRLAQRGVDLYKISKLLGHYSIEMTQRYAHHCPESLRDGIQVLESDYNLTTVGENRNVSNA